MRNDDWTWSQITSELIKASRAIEVVEDQESHLKSEASDDAGKPKKGAKVYAAGKAQEGDKNENPRDYVPRDANGGRGGGFGRGGRFSGRGGRGGRFGRGGNDGNVSNKKHCDGCGNAHGKDECPAFDNECGFCDFIGHFERCCNKKHQARAKAREETRQQESSQRKKKTMGMEEEEEEGEDEEHVEQPRSAKKPKRNVNFLVRKFNADQYDSREDWLAEEPYRLERGSKWYNSLDR